MDGDIGMGGKWILGSTRVLFASLWHTIRIEPETRFEKHVLLSPSQDCERPRHHANHLFL